MGRYISKATRYVNLDHNIDGHDRCSGGRWTDGQKNFRVLMFGRYEAQGGHSCNLIEVMDRSIMLAKIGTDLRGTASPSKTW